MPKINVLSRTVAELIAAGEVVERPSSAMKELIENSIDAGSHKITVEIKNGGITYMRVTDDGCGIAPEDVPKAFISHATSKIADADDLNAIFTLGFRGEALASVAAVAKVEMLTKERESTFGARYVIEGGKEILADTAGCPDGTTVVVRDLFYNTPARMKFLKRDVTEGTYVSDIVTKIALAHPEISFRFIRDGKQTLFTPGDGDLRGVIAALFGADFAAGMVACSYALDGIAAHGYVSLPRAGKATRNSQYFFVNNRYVKIPVGAAALDNAYKNSVMVGKFPACVLNITVPAETVDVNVHPAKTEVRFSDEKRIYNAVYYAAKNAITESDYRPALPPDSLIDARPVLSGEQTQMEIKTTVSDILAQSKQTPPVKSIVPPTPNQSPQVTVYEPGGKDFFVAASPAAPEIASIPFAPAVDTPDTAVPAAAADIPVSDAVLYGDPPPVAPSRPVNIDITYDEPEPTAESSAPVAADNTAAAAQTQKEVPYFVYIGEIFDTYLLAQYEGKLLIVDKHALHERILFNEISARGACTMPQVLLLPVTVRLDRREYAAVLENLDALESIGFSVSDFGDGAVLVRECPVMFAGDDIAAVISELAGEMLRHSRELLTEKLDWLYHSASCRAAVKGGSALTREDAILLISRVLTDDDLRYCPHGRPVMMELTQKELEKQFGRIQ